MIRQLQGWQQALGYYGGPLDGIPGRDTEHAVRAFQRSAGITVDTMIGPEVIRRLKPPWRRIDTTDEPEPTVPAIE